MLRLCRNYQVLWAPCHTTRSHRYREVLALPVTQCYRGATAPDAGYSLPLLPTLNCTSLPLASITATEIVA